MVSCSLTIRPTPSILFLSCLICLMAAAVEPNSPAYAQSITGPFASDLTLTNIGSTFFSTSGANRSRITQMALTGGPTADTRYLYMASNERGIRRLTYDTTTATLVAGSLENVATDIRGLGIAFHGNTLYASEPYVSAADPSVELSRIWRIEEMGLGDRTVIVAGIPRQDHGVNHIQIKGDSLYVGMGVRTRNGAFQTFSGDTYGESAYGGSVGVIDNLVAVDSTTNSAGFFPGHPTAAQYRDLIDGTNPLGASPFTTNAENKLRVHSSGTRNPFGLAIDGDGEVWFTVNFQRTENHVYDRNNLAAAEGDAFGGDGFQDDVHDQLFRAVEQADYGYRNGNWQDGNPAGNTAATDAGFFDPLNRAASFTFDNYVDPVAAGDADDLNPAYNQDYNLADPVGLGPSSSSNGFDFYQANELPLAFHKDAFIARWNGSISDGGDQLEYRDVVSVDTDTGDVQRIASGFRNPLDILSDGEGNLLIADWSGSIWLIRSANPMTSPHPFSWDADQSGNWSDRATWNADSLPHDDRLVPDAWGTARYAVIIDRPGANPTVTLDQDATVEQITIVNTLHLAAGNTLTVQDRLDIQSAGRLAGDGMVGGFVHSDGTVSPGSTTGILAVDGDYEQAAGGRLEIEIGGTTPDEEHDQMAVSGDVMLGGALELVFLDGFAPLTGQEFDLISFGGTARGTFSATSVLGLLPGFEFELIENGGALTMIALNDGVFAPPLAADFDSDGDVDGDDFLTWQSGFGCVGDCTLQDGDADGDNDVDGDDFLIWQNEFSRSADSNSGAVPEPSAALLALLLLIGCGSSRRRRASPCFVNLRL